VGDALVIGRTKKRLVRVHFKPEVCADSVDGILVGRAAGHYELANAKHVAAEGARSIDGGAWIPVDNVLYLQPLA
jgi:hypothetical protein